VAPVLPGDVRDDGEARVSSGSEHDLEKEELVFRIMLGQ
jgi:hypothetical protein